MAVGLSQGERETMSDYEKGRKLRLTISQWKTRPQSGQIRHFYGTVRDEKGEIVQEILQCATRARVVEVAKEWAGERELEVAEGTEQF